VVDSVTSSQYFSGNYSTLGGRSATRKLRCGEALTGARATAALSSVGDRETSRVGRQCSFHINSGIVQLPQCQQTCREMSDAGAWSVDRIRLGGLKSPAISGRIERTGELV